MKRIKQLLSYLTIIIIIIIFLTTIIFKIRLIGGETLVGYRTSTEKGLINSVKGAINGFDKGINTNLAFQKYFIDIYGGVQRVMKSEVLDDVDPSRKVYKIEENYLTFSEDKLNMKDKSSNVIEFNNYLKELNIPLIYIQAPFKVDTTNFVFSDGTVDYSNENANIMIDELTENKIQVVDLREIRETLPLDDRFYKTDHHWKPKYALRSLDHISESLRKNHINIKINQDEFESKYELSFLGSQGRRVGRFYNEKDIFSLLIPKEEGNYSVKQYNTDPMFSSLKTGSFEETVIDYSLIESKDLFANRYASYFGDDFGYTEIINYNIEKGNVLVISDSFGLSFNAFLSTKVNQVHVIDQRHYSDSIRTKIEEINNENPIDIILILYNPSIFKDDRVFRFK